MSTIIVDLVLHKNVPSTITADMAVNVLKFRTTAYDFLVIVCAFVRPKASGSVHVSWSWHKRSQGKNKLIQNDALCISIVYTIAYLFV